MEFLTGLILGLVIGGNVGLFVSALLLSNKKH